MKKSLITFSTVDGHTKLICKKIAEYSANQNVEVIPISQINDLSDYKSIVIGASIRYGKYRKEVFDFIKNNINLLQSMENSFFSVNAVARKVEKSSSKTKNYFIQVNIGKEIQKSGVLPEDLKNLYNLCLEKKLKIIGLMCIPPINKSSKEFFYEMKLIRDNLNRELTLSMGMSDDYKISLECESNLIRIGSRIFK